MGLPVLTCVFDGLMQRVLLDCTGVQLLCLYLNVVGGTSGFPCFGFPETAINPIHPYQQRYCGTVGCKSYLQKE